MADEGDIRAIHLAAREGRAQDVARMLDEDPQLLSSRWRDDTLLRHAAREGHAGVVGVLLERGAEVNTTNVIGDTALHLAAQYGHEELVSILLGSGADVFRRGAEGWTALMCACTRSVAVVRLLLRSMGGHGLDERNLFERTALWIACDWGHVDILQALLLAGADHTIADNAGHPPQQLAGLNGHPQCVALIEVSTVSSSVITHPRCIRGTWMY
jgi:ankyrin repeat protein